MTVHWVNVAFMVSLAVFASVAAAVLAVLGDRWWDNRKWRKEMQEAERTAPLAAEAMRDDLGEAVRNMDRAMGDVFRKLGAPRKSPENDDRGA